MKKNICYPTSLLLCICIHTICAAQTKGYTKTLDDPAAAVGTMINLMPTGGFIASGKYVPSYLTIGAGAIYGMRNRIGFEGEIITSYYSTKNTGGLTAVEGGAFFNFHSHEKIKDSRVLLNYRRTTDVNTTRESYSYINVPAKWKFNTGVRGGLLYSRNIVQTDGISIAAATSTFTLTGFYLGIQSTQTHLIKGQVQGTREPRYNGAIFRMYADVSVYPVSKIADPFLAASIKTGNIGARAGILWVPHPYHSDLSLVRRLSVGAELGQRPVDGIYFKGGVYWGLLFR